jgi:NAD(P)-dependent dehydrogenase (short-subunit alcohol dehydrogenase family)
MESWRRQFEVNVLGQVAVTQAFLPLLRKAPGRIVFISSVSGGLSVPYLAPYAASKHAIEAIVDSLRLEVWPWKIRVSAVEPGPIDTLIWGKSDDVVSDLWKSAPHDIAALYEGQLPMIRKMTEEAAKTAAPVETVVRAVVHALTAEKPKTRYVLNCQGWLYFRFLKMLPDRFRDWIIRKATGSP